MTDTITIPVQATYRIVNRQPVMIAAEYAKVSAAAVARFLLERFGVPVEEAKQ